MMSFIPNKYLHLTVLIILSIFLTFCASSTWYVNESKFVLGRSYLEEGSSVKINEGVKLISEVAKNGYTPALLYLADLYYAGTYVTQNYSKAAALWRQGSINGNASAQYLLGNAYYHGKGVPLNLTKALNWWKTSADNGYSHAYIAIGNAYQDVAILQNYKLAMEYYQKAVDEDNAVGMYYVGNMYRLGLGVNKNICKAKAWYIKTIKTIKTTKDQNNSDAEVELGKLYMNHYRDRKHRCRINKSNKMAFTLFKMAANNGNAVAQKYVGWFYQNGMVVPKSYQKAAKWYQLASNHREASAQAYLGSLYHQGLGVPKNFSYAFKLFKQSAQQGNIMAQYMLGFMYYKGQGVAKNYHAAYVWLNIANRSNVRWGKLAKKIRNLVATNMTTGDIESAQASSLTCLKSNFKFCDTK